MGSSTSLVNLVSLSVGFRSKLWCFNCEESCVKHEQLTCSCKQNSVKDIFLEDHNGPFSSEEEDDDDFSNSAVKELGISLFEAMHIHDHLEEPLCVSNLTFKQENCKQKEIEALSFETDVLEGLDKYASMHCFELVQLYPVISSAGEGLPCLLQNENFPKAENRTVTQSLPITAPKLVSALKGSRAQQGKHLSMKLRVKWAPEVYDPPVTSSSHTVKGPHRHRHLHHHHHHHHQRPKSKKDYYKQACSKGKSSRSTVIERRHSQRRTSGSLTDPQILMSLLVPSFLLQALGCNKPLPNPCGQSKVELLDLASVSRNETVKYGGNCYIESLATPVQLFVAKAS